MNAVLANRVDMVVICGSTRFIEEMRKLEIDLTCRAILVFAPTKCDLKKPHPMWNTPSDLLAIAQRLAAVHYAAILRCKYVIVYGDYVGDSVCEEIRFTQNIGTPIYFTDQKLADRFGGEFIDLSRL